MDLGNLLWGNGERNWTSRSKIFMGLRFFLDKAGIKRIVEKEEVTVGREQMM